MMQRKIKRIFNYADERAGEMAIAMVVFMTNYLQVESIFKNTLSIG